MPAQAMQARAVAPPEPRAADAGALTDRQYWRAMWAGHVPAALAAEHPLVRDLLDVLPAGPARFLDIGGFPGELAAWTARCRGYQPTVLDWIVVSETLRAVERANELAPGTLRSIEGDFFSIEPEPIYDVVYSGGFIEHFDDVTMVLRRHAAMLAPGGLLLVTVPNLRGLEGLVQRAFDPETYRRHNTRCMAPDVLCEALESLGLVGVKAAWHGPPHLWLDEPERVSRFTARAVALASGALSRVPFRGRWVSPWLRAWGRLPG